MSRILLKYGGFILGIISGFMIGFQFGIYAILSEIKIRISMTTNLVVKEVTHKIYNDLLILFSDKFSPLLLDQIHIVGLLLIIVGLVLIYYSKQKSSKNEKIATKLEI